MDTLDFKLKELFKQLPQPLKLEALNYLKVLGKKAKLEKPTQAQVKEAKAGFGGAKAIIGDLPDNLDHISVSEDFEEFS